MNITQKIKAWRSKKYPKAVIKQSCLEKIPVHLRSHFVETYEEPTASVGYGSQPSSLVMAMIAEDIADGALDSMLIGSTNDNNQQVQPDDFQGFGGGDTGGGGAGDTWTPDPPQSQEYSSDPTPDSMPGFSMADSSDTSSDGSND